MVLSYNHVGFSFSYMIFSEPWKYVLFVMMLSENISVIRIRPETQYESVVLTFSLWSRQEAVMPQSLSHIKGDIASSRCNVPSILEKESKPCSFSYFQWIEPEEILESNCSSGNLHLPRMLSLSVFQQHEEQATFAQVTLPSIICFSSSCPKWQSRRGPKYWGKLWIKYHILLKDTQSKQLILHKCYEPKESFFDIYL